MSSNAPEQSVPLTFAQMQSIDRANNRLENLGNEIRKATDELSVVSKDLQRVSDERDYLRGHVVDLQNRVVEEKANLANVVSDIQKAKDVLFTVQKESSELSGTMATQVEEIKKERDILNADIATYNEQKEILNIQKISVQSEMASVEKAKEAFRVASETVTWK